MMEFVYMLVVRGGWCVNAKLWVSVQLGVRIKFPWSFGLRWEREAIKGVE